MKGRRRAPGDGSIYQRPDGVWCASIEVGAPLGVRRRRRFTAKTREAVKQKLIAATRDGVARAGRTEIETVADLLDDWLAGAKTRVAHRTYASYDEIVRTWLKPALGRAKVRDLKPETIDRMVRSWNAHPKTIKNRVDALKTALGLAVRRRIIVWNPAAAVELPRVPEYEAKVPTIEDLGRLLAAARTRFLGDYRALILVAAASGLRRGELCALVWDDFDPKTGRLRVSRALEVRRRVAPEDRIGEKRPKGHRSDDVYLPDLIVDVLEQRRAEQARYLVGVRGDTRIFDDNGKTMHPDTLGRRMSKIAKDAGLAGIRLHDLRHAFGTWLTNQGVSSRIVQKQMRHADPRMTARYTRNVEDGARAAAAVLDGLLRTALGAPDGPPDGPPKKKNPRKR